MVISALILKISHTPLTALALTPLIFALIIIICAVLSVMSHDKNSQIARQIYAMLALAATAAFICGAFGMSARYQTVIFASASALTVPYARSVKRGIKHKNNKRGKRNEYEKSSRGNGQRQ